MRIRPWLLVTFFVLLGFASWYLRPWAEDGGRLFISDAVAETEGSRTYGSSGDSFAAEVVVSGLKRPWDVAFLSDEEILVTEKSGRLLRVNLETGAKVAIAGMPKTVVHGQGGLHAVVLHPKFEANQWLYLSHAVEVPGKQYTTRLTRARLVGDTLVDLRTLVTAKAESSAGQHFGGAILFDTEGFLFLSVGDRGSRDLAQDLGRHNGKILRLRDDGSVPQDNPLLKVPGALPEIYSYGHRNPQGMSLDPATGQVWAVEHGPQGGDEINRILPGRNYGWPVITYGEEYGGGRIGDASREGMEQPVHYYVPSIATGGMAFYTSALFPAWQGSVFVTALRGQHLNRVTIQNGKSVGEQRLLSDWNLRMRSVRVSPSGELWVVADNGVILRVVKASPR